MRRWMAGVAITLAVVGALAVPAHAAKGGNKETFQVTCGGVVHTITSANGKWAAGVDTASSTHFIPAVFHFVVTDESGAVVFTETQTKRGHHNQEKVTCTFEETFTENGETLTFSGMATVVRRPR